MIRVVFAWTLKSSAATEPLKSPPRRDSEGKPCEVCPLFQISQSSCGCAIRKSFLNSNRSCSPHAEPYESTRYQGMVDFHWAAGSLTEAKSLAESLVDIARHRDLVLLHIMSRVDGIDSISIKDERRTKH